jgi:hypothetical protein
MARPTLGLWIALALSLAAPARAADAPDGESAEIEEIEELDLGDVEVVDPEGPATWWGPGWATLERVISVPTALTVPRLTWNIIVDHRTWQSFTRHGFFTAAHWRENFFDLVGFDAGALKIGLGLRFGILDDLEVGAYRLNGAVQAFDTWEFDLKYQALEQAAHWVNLAVRAGGTWFAQEGTGDAGGGFAQVVVDHLLWDRLRIGAGLMFHSDSTGELKTVDDTDWSLAIPAYLDIRILGWLAWNVEVTTNVAGYGERWPNFASSLRFITNRHTFALVLSNYQYLAGDGLVANSFRGFQDLVVGFTLTREIGM